MINNGEAPPAPKLDLLVTTCTTGTCPTIYKTDRGTIAIQGFALDASSTGVQLGPGELLVEIPAELLAALRPEGS